MLRRLYMEYQHITRPRDRKIVFFSSFFGQYSDNPRAISEAIHNIDPSIELWWEVNSEAKTPEYIKRISGGKELMKAYAWASAWVFNWTFTAKNYIKKWSNIFFVETWHGDRTFKMVGYVAKKNMGSKYKHDKNLPICDDVDLYLAGSEFGIRKAHEAFNYYGEIDSSGMPRNDKLVNIEQHKSYIEQIKKTYGVEGKKILLFAPTFRDYNTQNQKAEIDLMQVMRSLNKRDEKWVCLLRAHSDSKGIQYPDEFECIDVSHIGDMADFLLISDILITDYSGSAGDYILTGRPCILALFDLQEYVSKSRNLQVNPKDAGFLVAENQEELNELLSTLGNYNHKNVCQSIMAYYGVHESGNAAEHIARKIISKIAK